MSGNATPKPSAPASVPSPSTTPGHPKPSSSAGAQADSSLTLRIALPKPEAASSLGIPSATAKSRSDETHSSPTAPQPHPPAPTPTQDPRIRRTRDTLGDALVLLMQQKPFDDITVQDLLDRAGVSRSTFYTHFRDKQDLFLSDVEDFLEAMSTLLTRKNAPAHRIAPVEELFTHVASVPDFHHALITSGKLADVQQLAQGYLARSIAQRLTNAGTHLTPPHLTATAQALAGALFAQLQWWLSTPNPLSPREMDTLFHQLSRPATCESTPRRN